MCDKKTNLTLYNNHFYSVSEEEFKLLNEFISENLGIFFDESKREIFVSRISRRLEKLNLKSFMDYYIYLKYNQDSELDQLIKAITNNETYFFRETYQLDAFFEFALENVLKNLVMPGNLRILSSGCSSGEEAYTINIIAKTNQYRMVGTNVLIDAFDINSEKIEIAKEAVYGPSSLRIATQEQIEKYFKKEDHNKFRLKKLYRENVNFFVGNILDPKLFENRLPYDVIFCRNVLIYFSGPSIQKAITNFAKSLKVGGLLFLGHSESIIGLSPLFSPIRIGDCIAYKRVLE